MMNHEELNNELDKLKAKALSEYDKDLNENTEMIQKIAAQNNNIIDSMNELRLIDNIHDFKQSRFTLIKRRKELNNEKKCMCGKNNWYNIINRIGYWSWWTLFAYWWLKPKLQ